MRPVPFVVAWLVLVAGLPVGVAPAAGATADTPPELGVEYAVSLTPDDPGHVDVTARFTLPETVDDLTVRDPPDGTVESVDGFSSTTDLSWDGTTRSPTLTYRLPVNVTVAGSVDGRAPGSHLYADTGEWALVRAPTLAVRYAASERLTVNRSVVVDGPGVAGESMVFLGPNTVHERTVAGQRLRLVVPRAANLTESPEAVLEAVGQAARRLSFGERDSTVTMVAAPTDGVQWASTGLQRGAADFWVRDVQAVGTAENVWVHEYVHTRQSYRTTPETRWTTEAAADYYAALFAYEAGSLPYDGLRVHLREGRAKRFEDAVLADPATWDGTLANYVKGALVLGAVDRQVRLATDGEATLQDVFERVSRDPDRVEGAELLAAVEAVADGETRAFTARYTETAGAPAVWNRSEHAAAFGPRATFQYTFLDPVGVTGPYRTGQLDGAAVPDETLRLPVEIENAGLASGVFTATLYVDGEAVDTRNGSLAAGASRRLTLRVPVDSVPADGRLTLRLGGATRTVAVEPPATPPVTNLTAPERVRPGESFVARATLRNRADRPGERRLTVRVDGEAVANRTVRLGPGEVTTVDQRLTLPAGTHEVAVGERTARVAVTTATATGDGRTSSETAARSATDADGAGFGMAAALAALALLGSLARRE